MVEHDEHARGRSTDDCAGEMAADDGTNPAATLGKIPVHQVTSDAAGVDGRAELTLIEATRRLLASHGHTHSSGAVRDLSTEATERFGPAEAVSALQTAGLDASFGAVKLSEFSAALCPCVAFGLDGTASLLTFDADAGGFTLQTETSEHRVDADRLFEHISEYLILAAPRSAAASAMTSRHWFWNALRQNNWLYAQVIAAAALSNFLGLSTSLFIMVVYDRVVPNEAIESLLALTVGVVIALVFDFVIKSLRAQFVDRAGKRADAVMTRAIFNRILDLQSDRRQQSAGSMASVVREFDTLREFFTSATLVAVVDLPFIFLFIWVISVLAGPLAWVAAMAVPIVVFVGVAIQPMMARITRDTMQNAMNKQGVLIETLNGLETVQATGSGRLMRQRFETASNAQSELGFRSRVISQFAINWASSTQQFAQIATIFYGVFLITDGVITMGALIAAVILGGRTLAPLSQLAAALTRAHSARQAYRSLSALMGEPGDHTDTGRSRLSRPKLGGEIELKGATYTVPGTQTTVIPELSIKIPAGQKVAILGRMGSGKSTIARMIGGLIAPSAGSVLIDGVDLRQLDPSDLRRNVGIMLQDLWLFSGTVRQNIQLGFHEYGDERILEVAKLAGVDDFVATHPQGYDMEVRERGQGLSGGQRQAICLARALLHEPSLLILDEPTSSMDTATERAVIDRLRDWGDGKTMVMVTHRNALLELADRVLVIDGGKVIADTTPAQLLRHQGGARK